MSPSLIAPVGVTDDTPAHLDLFPRFERRIATFGDIDIAYVIGGSGPPLLLLHGNPLTHVMWHLVTPTLAETYTVIAPDLRGYGDSSKPEGGGDHSDYSFRTMAMDQIHLMDALGCETFHVCGHDRGARVGFRLALDHPDRVKALSALDIIPTFNVLNEVSRGWASESYHWFFMAQKAPFPEKLLSADLDYYIQYKLNKKGVGLSIFDPRAMAEYVRCATPEQIHGVCEDYRATLGVDFDMDSADHGNKRIQCPVQVLWGSNSHCGRHFKPIEAWSEWADDVTGTDIPTGHYPAEQSPDVVLEHLVPFLARVP